MKSVNGAQFLSITFLLVLFAVVLSCYVWNCYSFFNKYVCITILTWFELIIVALNLMLLLSYLSFNSSFISTQFLVLNLDAWFAVSSYRFVTFDIPLLYYYYYYYYCYYYYYHHHYYYHYYWANTQGNYTGKYCWNWATTSSFRFQEPFSIF